MRRSYTILGASLSGYVAAEIDVEFAGNLQVIGGPCIPLGEL